MTPEGQKAVDAAAQITGGGENEKALYDITSSVFGNVAKDAQGDPAKMQELMMKAQQNPEAFFNSLTPQQKKAIEDLSKKVPAARSTATDNP